MFDGPWGKVLLGQKIVQTLGWRWVATRLYLEAEHRSGALRRRTPVSTWDDWALEGSPTFQLGGLHPDKAGEIIRDQPAEVADQLREYLEMLKQRRFDVFGTRAQLDSWHHDPIDGATYPAAAHWSQVKELPDADLKLIWEPSRFGWAFDLARLHALEPSSSAAEIFWSLFDDWCKANQPMCGVNWKCGQEAAVRFMAVTFAVVAFDGAGMSDQRRELLAKFADVTARRIKANWRYAQSQDNNHIVSEAVGLIGVALRFPDLAISPEALRLGERLLTRTCKRLVFEDGGTSQYSSNYHRVFVDNFIWAVWLYRTANVEPLSVLVAALERAADFMCAITNPIKGDMASFGHNDGALLLPLATNSPYDVRSTLLAASCLLDIEGQDRPPHAALEGPNWLCGKDPATHQMGVARKSNESKIDIRSAAGVAIVSFAGCRVVIRGGTPRFRPPQCDFGSYELWIDGIKVVSDRGTSSYKAVFEDDYSRSGFHNSPFSPGIEQMTRISRFLWADWPKSAICATSTGIAVLVIPRTKAPRFLRQVSWNEMAKTFTIYDSLDIRQVSPVESVHFGQSIPTVDAVLFKRYGQPITNPSTSDYC